MDEPTVSTAALATTGRAAAFDGALSEQARMLRTLIGNLDGLVYRCRDDACWTMEFVSDGCERLTGYPAADLLHNHRISYGQIVHPDDLALLAQVAEASARTRERYTIEYRIVRADGAVRWVWERGTPVFGPDATLVAFEGFVEDVTERKSDQERIAHQASYDALTGLANRSQLNARLAQAIAQAELEGQRVAVAFVDLDHFKFINDTFGHQLGDTLLQTMAERLRGCVRERDTVARQGGDEFVLVLPHCAADEDLTGVVQRVHAAVGEPWGAGRREFHVTCSIGVAVYPQDGRNADLLLRNADAAMYKAKESGRNTFQFFTPELNRLVAERIGLEQRLRSALKRRQFLLHFQPRVDLRSQRIVGAEALLRWRMPRRGLVSPARFIAVAEDTGLIVPIGKWVLHTACQQNKAWQMEGLPPIVISVNVSPRQFRQDDIVATIAEALQQSDLDPRFLQIELTEGLAMHDAEKYVGMLGRISALGVQIAVDDFGTGYSSLSYLKRFPVDHLKVDRSFVKDLATDPDDAAIVQAIIALGHKLGLKVVAEGVETLEQFDYLRRTACDEMQGYYFSKPLIASDFGAMLADQSAEIFSRLRAG